jgi:hypothetical protein
VSADADSADDKRTPKWAYSSAGMDVEWRIEYERRYADLQRQLDLVRHDLRDVYTFSKWMLYIISGVAIIVVADIVTMGVIR